MCIYPTCHSCPVEVSCGQPVSPSNGRVDTSAGTSFGDVARYSCDEGYMLIGLNETTCQADGQWNGSVPTCESELLKQDNTVCFYECHHACSMAVVVLRCAFEQHSIYVYCTKAVKLV